VKTFDARTIERWRAWLEKHHASASEVWLIFHKQHTGTPSVDYLDALDEALCYGWIDSLVRRLDDDRYARKFTPRKPRSKWSTINQKRYAVLETAGRLKSAGKARSPQRAATYGPKPTVPTKMPADIAKAIKTVPSAWEYFNTLAPSHQRHYIGWICVAKRPDTRQRRLNEAIRLLSKRQKLGLK